MIPASVGKCQLDNKKWRRVRGCTGEDLFITRELDEEKLRLDLEELKRSGIESLAVVLAHSYTFVIAIYINNYYYLQLLNFIIIRYPSQIWRARNTSRGIGETRWLHPSFAFARNHAYGENSS